MPYNILKSKILSSLLSKMMSFLKKFLELLIYFQKVTKMSNDQIDEKMREKQDSWVQSLTGGTSTNNDKEKV